MTENIHNEAFLTDYIKTIIGYQYDNPVEFDISEQPEDVVKTIKSVVSKLLFYYTSNKINVDVKYIEQKTVQADEKTKINETIEVTIKEETKDKNELEEPFEVLLSEEPDKPMEEIKEVEEVSSEETIVFPTETINVFDETTKSKKKRR